MEALVYKVKVKCKIRSYADSILHDIREMDDIKINDLIESLSPIHNRQ